MEVTKTKIQTLINYRTMNKQKENKESTTYFYKNRKAKTDHKI